jgi:hypothetical protein
MDQYRNTVLNTNDNITFPSDNYSFLDNMNENSYTPQPMPGNVNEDVLYPYEASAASSFLNVPVQGNNQNYAKGGQVKKKNSKKPQMQNPYPFMAEMLRQHGGEEDVVLAHINPIEEQMLKVLSGGGTQNPVTGLPQYGFNFKNPGKWLKGSLGGVGGAIIGNMLLPGIGGIIGGGLGGMAGSAIRGRKDFLQAGLRGAAMGTALPSISSLAGSGLSSLGATGLGSTLSNYGAKNSIMTALGLGGASAGSSGLGSLSSIFSPQSAISNTGTLSAGAASKAVDPSFLSQLGSKSADFFSSPQNLLSTAVLGSQFLNRPKPDTPERQADRDKRYQMAMLMSPEELRRKEEAMLGEEQMRRRVQRNKYLPEERLGTYKPMYSRVNNPEEYRRTGKWINYYDNPDFMGNPVNYRKGGAVQNEEMLLVDYDLPNTYGDFVYGGSGGQEDNVRTDLPDNSYIMPADVVSHVGDGNSLSGAERIKALISNGEFFLSPKAVEQIGKGDHNKGVKMLDNLSTNIRKHKNVKSGLPPKTKSAAFYMRG